MAKEEGCNLEPVKESDSESALLDQLRSTESVIWSPNAEPSAVQALSDLLAESL